MMVARLLVPVTLLLACSKGSDSKPKDPPVPAKPAVVVADAASAPTETTVWYRAVIGEKQATAVPFFLQLPAGSDEALIASGPDRVRAKIVSRPPKLVLEFDILHTRIEATGDPKGVLEGTWDSTSGSWGKASLSFRAEPIKGPEHSQRFPYAAGGPDATGVWKLKLPDQAAKLTLAAGANNELTATLAFPTGNLVFLAGNQEGKTIRMSAFDGASPYLLVLEIDDGGKKLAGSWTAGQAFAWKEQLTGDKGEFVLEHQTKLSGARPKLKIPQLAAAPYAGSPVIVELGGSWCPACGHSVVKLRQLQEKYAAKGLQLLMLSYEFTDDPAYNKKQAEHFKTKYKVPWEVVPVDGDLEKYNEIMPAGLEHIDASGFPVTIFVARDGTIEGFHTGFPRDEWGDVYKKAIDAYDSLAAKIVDSPTTKPK